MPASASGLIVAGILILVSALLPVRRLMKQLPQGSIRGKWALLTVLILLFIAAYLAYGAVTWNRIRSIAGLIVPVTFFLGAVFVLLVSSLSLDTALDVKRISTLELENITDPLTGLYNRRYLDRRIDEEVKRAHRYHFPLSVLMLDIDHFKDVNDRYGHRFGDVVLSRLGQAIAQSVRKSDVVARYGGEEILIIATHTPIQDATGLGERLRKLVEGIELPAPESQDDRLDIRVTVSVGIAELNKDHNSSRLLIQSADAAMYRAKDEGRNRIAVSEESQQAVEG